MNGIRTPGVERLQDPAPLPTEDDLDRSLRPRRLEDFVGQERVKEQLAVFIQAARARGEALDHVLLHRSARVGQNLAGAHRCRTSWVSELVKGTSGPVIERPGDPARDI